MSDALSVAMWRARLAQKPPAVANPQIKTQSRAKMDWKIACLEYQKKHNPPKVEFPPLPPRRQMGVKIADIKKAVGAYYGLFVSEIESQRRDKGIIRPRQVVYYLCKKLTGHSLPFIGRSVGFRDHTTILSGIRKIERLVLDGEDVRFEIEDLEKHLIGGQELQRRPRPLKPPAPVKFGDWSDEDAKTAINLRAAGMTYAEIGVRVNRTWKSVKALYRRMGARLDVTAISVERERKKRESQFLYKKLVSGGPPSEASAPAVSAESVGATIHGAE